MNLWIIQLHYRGSTTSFGRRLIGLERGYCDYKTPSLMCPLTLDGILVGCWVVCVCPPPSPFRSACEGRNVWGDRRPSLLQQEQDWGEISNGQMFLFPRAGSRHHPGHALLCGRCVPLHAFYNFCAFCFTSARKKWGLSLLKKKAKEAAEARTMQGVLALAMFGLNFQQRQPKTASKDQQMFNKISSLCLKQKKSNTWFNLLAFRVHINS